MDFGLLNRKKIRDTSTMSLISIPNRTIRLLLHKELHHDLSTIDHWGSGAEDGSDTGFVEEVIILCGDDATGGDLVRSGLQRVEKPRFSRELPHFFLSP